MKQTAVEWLYEQILLTPLDIRSINKCLEQAKEMEKEQIIDACKQCSYSYEEAEQYYNETYKNTEL
jgi:hypothetical protein